MKKLLVPVLVILAVLSGVVFAVLAILFLLGAWMASGHSKETPSAKNPETDK
jgi:hypothetical protein